MSHSWSDAEMEETIDICLAHPPGAARVHPGQLLAAKMNNDPSNPINPEAIGQALQAAEHAINGDHDKKPRPSEGLKRLVAARRKRGALVRQWAP